MTVRQGWHWDEGAIGRKTGAIRRLVYALALTDLAGLKNFGTGND